MSKLDSHKVRVAYKGDKESSNCACTANFTYYSSAFMPIPPIVVPCRWVVPIMTCHFPQTRHTFASLRSPCLARSLAPPIFEVPNSPENAESFGTVQWTFNLTSCQSNQLVTTAASHAYFVSYCNVSRLVSAVVLRVDSSA